MLSEHHDTASGLKMDGVASTSLIQNKHTESEIALQEELHDLEKDSMEKKLLNQKRIEQLKQVSLVSFVHSDFALISCLISTSELLYQQKHQLDLMEMENHYKKKVRGE